MFISTRHSHTDLDLVKFHMQANYELDFFCFVLFCFFVFLVFFLFWGGGQLYENCLY